MMIGRFGYLVAVLILCLSSQFNHTAGNDEDSHENLSISSLRNGDILSSFNFTIRGNGAADANLRLIPSLFRRLFHDHDIRRLRMSFTQGFWQDIKWGNHRNANTPSGTQILIKFGATSEKSVDERWSTFLHQINGIFCTSMLEMSPALTSTPTLHVHHHWPSTAESKSTESDCRYGSLPSEVICSENLKTWKRLLPCKQQGLVLLLEPRNLLSSDFHSLTLSIDRDVVEGNVVNWLFELGANTVHRGRQRDKRYWSLQNLFAKRLVTKCGVSRTAEIFVENTLEWVMKPAPDSETSSGFVVYHVYDLRRWSGEEAFTLSAEIVASPGKNTNSSNVISVQSFATSSSQVFGVLRTQLKNPFAERLSIVFTQMVPWQISVYLHTLRIRCRAGDLANDVDVEPTRLRFQLSKDFARPLLVEFAMELPSESTCRVSADYETVFLKITSFPADANSGVYVPGPIIALMPSQDSTLLRHLRDVKLHGEPILILLPVPDFSMPFNVIVIVCSLIAMFYGNIFTLTTKLMKPVLKKDNKKSQQSSTLRQKLRVVWDRLRGLITKKNKE